VNRVAACIFGGVAVLLLVAALAWRPATVAARTYLAVELIRFELRAVSDGVEITWETATETDAAYFKVKRGPAPNGPFADLTELGLVPAEGSTFSGAVYTEVDQTAAIGQTYRYQLYEINLSNAEQLIAAATVSLGPTPTPEVIGGGDSGATSTPAPTSTLPGGAGSTPTPGTTLSAGAATPVLTTTATITTSTVLTETDATLPATTAARTLGPTPTRFSFTPAAPGSSGSTVPVNPSGAEVAAPEVLGQGSADAYPAPAPDIAFAPLPAGEDGRPVAMAQSLADPGAASSVAGVRPGYLPDSVGRGQGSAERPQSGDETAEVAQEASSAARLLLWFGFIAGLFVFLAGIAVSIILSTRRRHGGPLQ
jgi:hypothetical protein